MECKDCGASNERQLYTALIHVEIPKGMSKSAITDAYLRASLVSAGLGNTPNNQKLLRKLKDIIEVEAEGN